MGRRRRDGAQRAGESGMATRSERIGKRVSTEVDDEGLQGTGGDDAAVEVGEKVEV